MISDINQVVHPKNLIKYTFLLYFVISLDVQILKCEHVQKSVDILILSGTFRTKIKKICFCFRVALKVQAKVVVFTNEMPRAVAIHKFLPQQKRKNDFNMVKPL